jgi:DNA mismatch repair ATPase MutL
MALTLAQSASVSRGQLLHVDEMKDISQRLFESSNILKSPSGKKIWHLITPDQLEFSFN